MNEKLPSYQVNLCKQMMEYCVFKDSFQDTRMSDIITALKMFFDEDVIEEARKYFVEENNVI